MKKALRLLLLMLLVFSIVPASFAQDSEGEEEEEAISRADADLVIWTLEAFVDNTQLLADQFAADFGVTVAVQAADIGDYDSVLPVAAPAGQGPDIFLSPHDKLGAYVASGLVSPLEIASPELFTEASTNAFNFNGEIYGLPIGAENVALIRNVDLVPEAPATWEEVEEISRAAAADNDDDFATNNYGFIRMEGDPYHFFPIQTAFGGYVFGLNEDGSYNPEDVGLGTEGSIAAAEFYDTLLKDGIHPPSVDYGLMETMFHEGQASMIMTGPWALNNLRDVEGLNYAISEIPGGGQPFLGVFGFLVSSFSEEEVLAGIFLNEYVATDEGMQLMFEADRRPPVFLSVIETLEDEDIANFATAGANGLAMPAIPEMAQVWDAWGNAVVLIGQQSEEAAAAFTAAGEQVETLIEEAAQN